MKLKEICNCLEDFAPLAYQESYDNAGLITGDYEMSVTGALICLDSTEDIIEEAIEMNCNLVIAHHPILFSGIKKIIGHTHIERTLIMAIKNNIAIYCAHTNLDNIFHGVNSKIAEKMGLVNCKILSPKNHLLRKLITFCPIEKAPEVRQALFSAGGGNIGNYDQCSFNAEGTGTFRASQHATPYVGEIGKQHQEKETRIEVVYPLNIEKRLVAALLAGHPYEEVAYDIISLENQYTQIGSGMIGELKVEEDGLAFLKKLKSQMMTACVRHTPLLDKKVKKVAICGGSGSFLINKAIDAGADVLVTGDIKYHEFFLAEGKLLIADIGHYESEQFTKDLFYDILSEKFPTFALHLSKINTNPINYI